MEEVLSKIMKNLKENGLSAMKVSLKMEKSQVLESKELKIQYTEDNFRKDVEVVKEDCNNQVEISSMVISIKVSYQDNLTKV